jgi:hypothetical protein
MCTVLWSITDAMGVIDKVSEDPREEWGGGESAATREESEAAALMIYVSKIWACASRRYDCTLTSTGGDVGDENQPKTSAGLYWGLWGTVAILGGSIKN